MYSLAFHQNSIGFSRLTLRGKTPSFLSTKSKKQKFRRTPDANLVVLPVQSSRGNHWFQQWSQTHHGLSDAILRCKHDPEKILLSSLESKLCVSLSFYAGQYQGRLCSLDENLAGGMGMHVDLKNCPRSWCPPLPGVLKNTHSGACCKVFPRLFYKGTMYGTRNNKTRKFSPSLSQNYRSTSHHSVLESMALVDSERLADWYSLSL